ncbi:MAG TPA: monofunctional biosynthetic peptidoglycan transglycosylase [Thermoanaerobaculia bacterium]|nr:monofunctional biosynthetic peptidoglycan transglycosylase [Thermoanaerobaculia bacterium]
MIASPNAAPRPRRRRRGCAPLFAIALAAAALWLGWQIGTWPDVAALAERDPETTAFIARWRGGGWRGPGREVSWRPVPYSRISRHLKHAVVVAEDIEFFSHDGFSRRELRAALDQAIQEKAVPRGASTITQQLAKNLWLSSSRNPLRKLEEALLTRQLERRLSKRRILELYLNVVEWGPGIYGAEAASRHWFGRSARSLSTRQAAELAAALPRPRSWHPGSDSRAYRRMVRTVERRMAKARWVREQL